MPETLRAACWSFAATDDVEANRDRVAEGIEAAVESGVALLLVPECALTGYPGAARDNLAELDWGDVAVAEQTLAMQAEDAGLALVLGTASPWEGGITNDALATGAVSPAARYRKRSLTPLDREHFGPGREAVVAEGAGWRLGLAICYDLRFPRVFAELARAGADAFVISAHLAGSEPEPGTKSQIMPAHCASRAAEWATPLLLCNTAAPDRWIDSGLWDARGLAVDERGEGLLLVDLVPRDALDPWYATIRRDALTSFFGSERAP